MYADTNVTIPGAKFPKHWFKNRYKIKKKTRFAYNSWTQCRALMGGGGGSEYSYLCFLLGEFFFNQP